MALFPTKTKKDVKKSDAPKEADALSARSAPDTPEIKTQIKKGAVSTNTLSEQAEQAQSTRSTRTELKHKHILIKPVLSEKSTAQMEGYAYTFLVHPSATKAQIRTAFTDLYKIKTKKINVINKPHREKRFRGRLGRTGGGRKAVIFTNKETIEFV